MHDGTSTTPDDGIDAGKFGDWLAATREVLRGRGEASVPCGDCTACCRASYFIHVAPDDGAARAAIPADILVPAPGLPRGHHVLGFDKAGRCPMFRGGACGIYDVRPRTCREYDCRILAAAGLSAGGTEKRAVDDRVRRWRFAYPTDHDRALHQAVRDAAWFLQRHARRFPEGFLPGNPTQLAMVAVMVADHFLGNWRAREAGVIAAELVDLRARGV